MGKGANMCAACSNLPRTLMLLFLSGALCSYWNVQYQQRHICAVKGSSVVIPCSFRYPDNEKVQNVLWGHERSDIYKGPFVFDNLMINNSPRLKFIGDRNHNCSFQIHQVEHDDAGEYTFRFITDSEEGKWTGKPGSVLKVVDLKVLAKPDGNRTRKEGDSVGLACINSCDDGNLSSAFSWFKNGQPIENEGPTLYLRNMSSTNSGNYTCSLRRHTGTTSGVFNIDVEYGPKNTSVSVRPSTEVDAGSNVTLICSSQENPPVENYTWFKIAADGVSVTAVGHGPLFISGDAGQYFCRATNKHGSQNSSVVTVKMKTHWATFNREALIVPTVAVLLVVTVVIAIRRFSKKRTKEPDTEGEDIQNEDYVNWTVFNKNQSQEGNGCEGAMQEVIYATVDFHTERESSMEQQMDSNHDDQSVIYSTVCS